MITHLFFADDILIFFKTTKDNTDLIKEPKQIREASGQSINYDKSTITFIRDTLHSHIQYIKDTPHLQICQGHELYLGLPTFSSRSKRLQFCYLCDRAAKKMYAWNNKLFSEWGREVLIKTVTQAIPTYVMPYFRVPSTINWEVENLSEKIMVGRQRSREKGPLDKLEEPCKSQKQRRIRFQRPHSLQQSSSGKTSLETHFQAGVSNRESVQGPLSQTHEHHGGPPGIQSLVYLAFSLLEQRYSARRPFLESWKQGWYKSHLE